MATAFPRAPLVAVLMTGILATGTGVAAAQSLRGSAASLDRQVGQAGRHDFTYVSGPTQLRRFVDAGLLVPVRDTRDFRLAGVSFPFARPEAKMFIERLAAQYRRGCGEQMVVTSLTRPRSHQPRNASDRSVHPTGMAIDLRRPAGRCRHWLESTLLSLEAEGVLEATRERRPPHYHVAVFPQPYAAHVDRLTEATGGRGLDRVYVVRRGDTLSEIAARHGTTAGALRQTNGLLSPRIYPGQTLTLPAQP